jgi:hypothetical protein
MSKQQLANGQVCEIDPADLLNQQALRLYESGQRDEAEAAWKKLSRATLSTGNNL